LSRWVRVQTDVFEHGVFASEPYTEREAWLWLISKAAWKDTKHRIGQVVVDVPVGSVFLTLREMQAKWRWRSDKRVRSFLAMLEREQMIELKSDAGKTQISVCNYSRYQDVGRTEDASGTQAGRNADAQKTPIHQYTKEVGSNEPTSPEPAKAAPVAVIGLPTVSDGDYPIFEADIAEWSSAFPAVDVRQQIASARQWLLANPSRRKTKRGMRRFVVSWLDRRQNEGRTLPSRPSTGPPPGKRMNVVEANLSRRAARDEPGSGRLDNGDVELLPPDGTRLRALVGDVAASLRWPDGSGRH
jgi:hypothetical protein